MKSEKDFSIKMLASCNKICIITPNGGSITITPEVAAELVSKLPDMIFIANSLIQREEPSRTEDIVYRFDTLPNRIVADV